MEFDEADEATTAIISHKRKILNFLGLSSKYGLRGASHLLETSPSNLYPAVWKKHSVYGFKLKSTAFAVT